MGEFAEVAACKHKGFLIGQSDMFARADGGNRRRQPCRADLGGKHDVGFLQGTYLRIALFAV